MRSVAIIMILFFVAASARAIELFRYRLETEDGRKFEYVFEAGAETVRSSIDKAKATELAMNWVCAFHHLQVGSIEAVELREKPVRYWLICIADTTSGPVQHLLFAVVLPNGQIVQPKVSERL